MIGLGSNRLTVCRRGGMSVTQAGRGGMEWLAGGRMPSWVSPYSAAATAALKAQFPTQWPTIRDYGFAHPALVPFINEDPMLVMSLIEGLGTRWLVGDGNCYFATDVSLDYNDTIKTLCNVPSGQNNMVLGTRLSNGKGTILGIWSDGKTYTGWFSNNAPALNPSLAYGTDLEIEMNKNGLWYNGTKATSFDVGSSFSDTSKFHWFTCPAGSGVNANMSKGKGAYAEIVGKVKLVPFKRNGANGALDLQTLTYIAKSGTGTFTELIDSPS